MILTSFEPFILEPLHSLVRSPRMRYPDVPYRLLDSRRRLEDLWKCTLCHGALHCGWVRLSLLRLLASGVTHNHTQ
jgi:hypothetical protein